MADLPILESAPRTPFGTLLGDGGPTALTPERAQLIIAAVEQGMPYTVAAERAGISPDTLRIWRRKGEAGEHPAYVEFFEAIEAALARYEARHLENIDEAAFGTEERKPQWQASAWRLERDQRLEGRHQKQSTIKTESDPDVVQFVLVTPSQPEELSQEERVAVAEARARRRRALARADTEIQDAEFTVEE